MSGGKSRLRIGYIATTQFPSTETDTEQAMRSVDALWQIGVDIDMILPRKAGQTQKAFEETQCNFYNIKGGFNFCAYKRLPQLKLEAERVVHVVLASIKYIRRYDIIHTRSRGVLILCVLSGQPAIFETYRDLRKSAPFFSPVLKMLSRSRFFLGAICHSSFSARSLQDVGISSQKIAVVYNGFDPTALRPRLSRKAARNFLDLPQDANIIVYTGNVQASKGLSILLKLARELPDTRLIIVGGQEKHLQNLRQEIATMKLDNVYLAGWVKHIKLAPYLFAADVLIIPPTSRPLHHYGRTVLPMKTFLFLGAGRPIIAPATKDMCEILKHNENAYLVSPDNLPEACNAIRTIRGDPKLSQRLGKTARDCSKAFSWRARAKKISKLYQTWQEAFQSS